MQTRVVAKVIVQNPDDKVLLLRRSQGDVRRPLQWDIPGGHTDGDEFANEAAARETREEAGLTLDPRKLQLVYSENTVVDEGLNIIWLLFVGYVDTSNVTISHEHDEYRWVAPEEALELIEYDRQKRMFAHVMHNELLA